MFLLTFKSLQTLCKYDNTETDMLLVNILEAKQCNCIYFSFFQQIFRKILSNTTENNKVNEQVLASKEGEKTIKCHICCNTDMNLTCTLCSM